jgi:hypothetical protein
MGIVLPCYALYPPQTWLVDVTAYQDSAAMGSVLIKATRTGAYHLQLPVGTYQLRTRYRQVTAAEYPMGAATIVEGRTVAVDFTPHCS